MGQPCQAGNFPAFQDLVFLISEVLFFFFSVQIINPCLGCPCGCPWVSPVAEKDETPSQARALYPKPPWVLSLTPWTFQRHKSRSYRSRLHPQLSLHCISHWLHDQTAILRLGRFCSTAVQRRAADSLSHLSLC